MMTTAPSKNSLIDVHCHLSPLSAEDLNSTLERSKVAGVSHLVAIGAGYGTDHNDTTLEIAKSHDNIVCALGIHPHDASIATDNVIETLQKIIFTEEKVRAVGEIGLDYHYMNSPKDKQQETLRRFIHVAKKTKKPIVIHDRDCANDCVDILKEEGARDIGGMVHCFSGSKELAQRYLDLGFIVSFTGIITFKKANDLREVVKFVPIERMTIETDAPFLAPVPHRGKPNEPSFVKLVAEAVAQIKNISFADVATVTTKNAKQLFKIQ